MLLHEDDDSCTPVAVPMTFGEWVDEGIAGRRPTLADLDYHCTTLFPPVRPRGWLEVRWLDCLPAGLAEVASAAITALLIDERAGDAAVEACAARRPGGVVDHHRQPRHARPGPGRGRRRHARGRRARRSTAPPAPPRWAEAVAERRAPLARQGPLARRRPRGPPGRGRHDARARRPARRRSSWP